MGAKSEYASGDEIAGKYVVESLLGESPSGRLYLAHGSVASQKLCLKFYHAETSSSLLGEPDFFLKAGHMTELEQENLCACLDVQEEMGLERGSG
jgi:hypothetical protein